MRLEKEDSSKRRKQDQTKVFLVLFFGLWLFSSQTGESCKGLKVEAPRGSEVADGNDTGWATSGRPYLAPPPGPKVESCPPPQLPALRNPHRCFLQGRHFSLLCRHPTLHLLKTSTGMDWRDLYRLSPDVQFSSVVQSCPTLCDPMNRSTPGLPVHHQLPESTYTHVHWVSDAIRPSHPLSSPSPPALNRSQHQGFFKWVSSSHQVAEVLEFQLQHQSFQWTPRTHLL